MNAFAELRDNLKYRNAIMRYKIGQTIDTKSGLTGRVVSVYSNKLTIDCGENGYQNVSFDNIISRPAKTPLAKAVLRAYRATPQYALDRLLAERTRWQRKETIASNKLAAVQRKLDKLAQENVNRLMGKEQQ